LVFPNLHIVASEPAMKQSGPDWFWFQSEQKDIDDMKKTHAEDTFILGKYQLGVKALSESF